MAGLSQLISVSWAGTSSADGWVKMVLTSVATNGWADRAPGIERCA
jgi:hypothetical protein